MDTQPAHTTHTVRHHTWTHACTYNTQIARVNQHPLMHHAAGMDGGWTGNSFPLGFLFHQYIDEIWDTQKTFLFNEFLLDENMHVQTHKHNTHTAYMPTNVHMVNMCTHAYEHTHSDTTPYTWTHASTNNIQHNTHMHMPPHTTHTTSTQIHTHIWQKLPKWTNIHWCTVRDGW
jgi:hypothetical protein